MVVIANWFAKGHCPGLNRRSGGQTSRMNRIAVIDFERTGPPTALQVAHLRVS